MYGRLPRCGSAAIYVRQFESVAQDGLASGSKLPSSDDRAGLIVITDTHLPRDWAT